MQHHIISDTELLNEVRKLYMETNEHLFRHIFYWKKPFHWENKIEINFLRCLRRCVKKALRYLGSYEAYDGLFSLLHNIIIRERHHQLYTSNKFALSFVSINQFLSEPPSFETKEFENIELSYILPTCNHSDMKFHPREESRDYYNKIDLINSYRFLSNRTKKELLNLLENDIFDAEVWQVALDYAEDKGENIEKTRILIQNLLVNNPPTTNKLGFKYWK